MDEKDSTSNVAQPPPEDLADWKSPTVMVNGVSISVKDYNKDPSHYNSILIDPQYLNTVLQQLSTKSKSILRIQKEAPTPKEKEKSK